MKKIIILFIIFISFEGIYAANYFVGKTGNNANSGTTESSAWLTITYAASRVAAGDIVTVLDGTYNESVTISASGSPSAYIVFKAKNKHQAKIVAPAGSFLDAIKIQGNYIEINGFDITTPSEGHGVHMINSHHCRIIGNNIHNCGGSGIQANYFDYAYVEGNICSFNAATNKYQCSGISLYQARDCGVNDAVEFRIIVRNNISYSNLVKTKGQHTDGNGIIIDDFDNSQTTGQPAYAYNTLVENNLCFDNGARGIHVFYTKNTTVRNNTTFKNLKDAAVAGTWKGDMMMQNVSNCLMYNNVVYGLAGSKTQALMIGNASNVQVYNNIIFNNIVKLSGNTNVSPIDATTGNLVGVDPKFISPGLIFSTANFRLQSTSAAIGAGTQTFGIPVNDLDGLARPVGTVDMGCYENQTSLKSGEIETIINSSANTEIDIFVNQSELMIRNTVNENMQLSVYDFSGRCCLKTFITEKQPVNISNLKAGLYIVNVKGLTSNYSEKIILK